jgi:hypothetical protein
MAKKSEEKPEFKNFEAILDLPERLAQNLRLLFHVSKADWDFMLDKVRQGKPYTEWRKSKGPGKGYRYFASPCDELKMVQTKVLNQFLSQIPIHFSRHGGTKGSSIFTNAERHLGFAKTLFAVDIVDAYPSVFRSRVRACLNKPLQFALKQFDGVELSKEDKELMLEAIVDLLVWNDRLPQGPPTSPRVFNIVCMKMDRGLFKLISQSSTAVQEYRLTIYSDNITISSDENIPLEVQGEIIKIIQKNGFPTHTRRDKMTYYSPETGTVPVITGLVLTEDGRMLMHSDKVNQLRGKLHNLNEKDAWTSEEKGEAAGTIGFIRQLYPKGSKLPSKLAKVVPKTEEMLKANAEAEVQ